jgi:tetratricopeptide (TPR) repeat protein
MSVMFRSSTALFVSAALLTGCASHYDSPAREYMAQGEYGTARAQMVKSLETNKSSRAYILSRMNLAIATLSDGQAESAEKPTKEMWDLLRTQGLNADKTVTSVIFTEGVKVWKGEPFEQALAYTYAAANYAQRGEWDNARTAAQESLFLLQDFGQNERGQKKSTLEIAQSAHSSHDLNGYQPVETNYTLGYLLTGVCSLMLDREDEARANFDKAVHYDARLKDLTDQLLAKQYNMLLLVDCGPGPQKVAYGPDNALAAFRPRFPSGHSPVMVSVDGAPGYAVAEALDVNALSAMHLWNNMEDVRIAKSYLGDALMAGAFGTGIGAAVAQHHSTQRDTAIAAIGLLAAGLATKATAGADTTYAQFMPQRTYLVPVNIPGPDSTIHLSFPDNPSWQIALAGVSPPRAGEVSFRYVRPALRAVGNWETSGKVVYASDSYQIAVLGDTLPYILGGTCVRRPSAEVLKHYQDAGNLTDMSLVDLENLYQEEGIHFSVQEQGMFAGMHVLEGGKSMVAPLAGTAGYARLFCQPHAPYHATSAHVKELQERYKAAPQGR